MDEPVLDQEKQKQAKEYARSRRRLMLLELVIGGLYSAAWLVSGLGKALADRIELLVDHPWFEVGVFTVVFLGLYMLIDVPLSFYSGYILPHRFDLSNQNLMGWIADLLKGLLVSGILGLLILQVVYALIRFQPEGWWLMAGIFIFTVNILLANLAPVLLLPLFSKLTPLADEYRHISDRLMRISEQAGARVKGVFQIDLSRRTKAANAALTGLGNTRQIILGDTLLNEFTAEEIETVFAHELGHHVHKDIPLGMAFQSLLTFGGLYLASRAVNWGVTHYGFEGAWDIAALPLLIIVIGGFGLVMMPLSNTFSRWRELKADAYALQVTGNGEAFARALIRLANQNLAEIEPEAWVEILLHSHPSLNKRITSAREYNQKQAT